MAEGRSKTSDQFYADGTRRWKPNKSWSQKRIRQWLTESPVAGPGSFDCDPRGADDIEVYLREGWVSDEGYHFYCGNQTHAELAERWKAGPPSPCACEQCGGDEDWSSMSGIDFKRDDPTEHAKLAQQRRTNTGRFKGYDELVKEWTAQRGGN